VTPYSVTYDGLSHTATGTATGVLAEDLSAGLDLSATTHTAAGSYLTDAWTFTGGQNYHDANGTVDDEIGPAGTTTAVASSQNPSVFGQSVTFTATVSPVAPGAGTRTGTVTFYDGVTSLGTGSVGISGNATFSTAALSVGSHSITATYGGDGN